MTEAKIVYRGNATHAVRAALGQLLTYRHFLYDNGAIISLVALFSGSIGAAYVDLLESLAIASVWSEDGEWLGSPHARDVGLAPLP